MAAPATTGFAAEMPLKAPAQAPTEVGWYFHGMFEVGGRIFFDEPPSGFGKTNTTAGWLTPLTTDSRAKFWEYGEKQEWVADNIHILAGSNDGRYYVDFWANHVGLDDQAFYLDIGEIGRHYLTVGWDQTPHWLSTSAKSIFGGVGTDRLTVDAATRTLLQANLANAQVNRDTIAAYINGPAPISNIDLKTERKKFVVAYRGTPTDELEFKVDYSHEHRTGTRPLGIGWGYGTGAATPRPASGSIEVPQPLDDTTQNYSASGQYVGSTPWGTPWNAVVKYWGSTFDSKIASIDVDNPFCITCTLGAPQHGPNLLRYSLYPDNTANAVSLNSGVTFPFLMTRLMSTTQYTTYRQDDPFIDTATNGVVVPAYPAASLNGRIDTLLSNTVLTSQLTNDITNKARIRYYDFDDKTSQLTFTTYNWADGGLISAGTYTRERQSYSKLNISDDVKWRVSKWLTLGGGYMFEKYIYENGEVDATKQHTGKIFADAHPIDWAHTRLSYQYSQRRYENYHDTGDPVTSAMRLFFIANRDMHKADGHVEIAVTKNLTVTPTGGVNWIDYPDNLPIQLGVTKDHQWNAGVEVGIHLNSDLKFLFSYNHENHALNMAECCGYPGTLAADTWYSDITQRFNTYRAKVEWNAIPKKLEFKAEFMVVQALEANLTTPCISGNANCTGAGSGVTVAQAQFPDEKNLFQRLSVIVKYFFDKDFVRQMGWTGDVVAKAQYIWEKNHNTNWATDTLTPYAPSGATAGDGTSDITNGGRSLFLAYANPNYDVQLLVMSLIFKW